MRSTSRWMSRAAPTLSVLALGLSIGAVKPTAPSDTTAFVGGMIVDGTGAPAYAGTLVISGDKIIAVGPDVAVPDDARVIDVKGQTVLPGLTDLHTHTQSSPAGGATSDWAKNLMAYVYSGVTSVAEVGSYNETFETLRRLRSSGELVMPRMALAPRLAPKGGHGAGWAPTVHTREVSTPQEANYGMDQVLAGPRPDLIKVFPDGWRYGRGEDNNSMNLETLRAIVERAHAFGIPVITHTVSLAQAHIAVQAGVDIIGHGISDTDADPELIEQMREKGTTYVPTLSVYEPRKLEMDPLLNEVMEPAAKQAVTNRIASGAKQTEEPISPSRQHQWVTLQRNVALMREGGVRIGIGTDAGMGNTFHGWATLRELRLLVASGLTPLEALTGATGVAAKALRVDSSRGTLSAGKLADLLIVSGHPYEDINDIERISSVYVSGKLVDRSRLKETIATSTPIPLTAPEPTEMIDDFEGKDWHTPNGQLWVDYADAGNDRSRLLWTRTSRSSSNHALLAFAHFGIKEQAYARLTLPFCGGGLLAVDASAYKGIAFDARGEGKYRFLVTYRGENAPLGTEFEAGTEWKRVTIPFANLKGAEGEPWAGKDLLTVAFELAGPAGTNKWIEIDNVAFER